MKTWSLKVNRAYWLGLFFIFGLITEAHACSKKEQAQMDYDMAISAMSQGNYVLSASFFESLMTKCPPTFLVHYKYGDVLYSLDRFTDAKRQYVLAQQLEVDDHIYARALAKEARVDAKQGDLMLSARKLKEAKRLGRDAWISELSDNVNIALAGSEITAVEVVRSLGLSERFVAVGEESSGVDIHIRFNLNDSTINESGEFETLQLIRALQHETFDGKKFVLIGHTDTQGSSEYNLDLAKRRAHSVLSRIIQEGGNLASRVSIDSKGESAPLCAGNDESAHQCNRRVEVLVK